MKYFLWLAAILLIGGAGYYEYQLQQKATAETRRQIEQLGPKITEAEEKNKALTDANAQLASQVDDTQAKIKALAAQVETARQAASEVKQKANAAMSGTSSTPSVAPVTQVAPPPVSVPVPSNGPLAAAKPSDLDLGDHSAPAADPLEPPGGIPRVYVGSAYKPAVTDMATKYDDWQIVRKYAGFHEHPVGWAPAFRSWGLGQQVLKAYAHRYFTGEEDIGGLSNGSGHGLTWIRSVFDQARLVGEDWTCEGLFVNFNTNKMVADPPKAAADLKAYCQGADAIHVPVFLLFSPVSPEAVKPEAVEGMNKAYENLPVWVWIAQHAGASGVGIDYPAGFYDNMSSARQELGRRIALTTQKAGLKFAWMLNGGMSVADTKTCAESLKEERVRPDFWVISHFHQKEYPGTPETGETVTGQARALIQGKY